VQRNCGVDARRVNFLLCDCCRFDRTVAGKAFMMRPAWPGTEAIMGDPDDGGGRRGALVGLLVAAVMLAVGLWLAHALTSASKIQDCVMAGRTNCNVIEPAR